MNFRHRLLTAAAVTAAAVFASRAAALVSLEDGRDHLFVDGSVQVGYDSNVFANAQSGGTLWSSGSTINAEVWAAPMVDKNLYAVSRAGGSGTIYAFGLGAVQPQSLRRSAAVSARRGLPVRWSLLMRALGHH